MDGEQLLTLDKKQLNDLVITREGQCMSTQVDGEVILLDLDSDIFISLDQIGSTIWELMASPISFATLCQSLREVYDVSEETCSNDVRSFLLELVDNGLIKLAPA